MNKPQRIPPGPGQTSVWDYPRPPRVEDFDGHIRVVFNGMEIVNTRRAKRVLETSHPPVYYMPPDDIRMDCLKTQAASTSCEWKGGAEYFDVVAGGRTAERAAWCYPDPATAFMPIKGHIAFYAGPMDACFIDDEPVEPQPGNFYGGWITKDIVGPFKGEAGTMHW